VFEKVRGEGLLSTLNSVREKLDESHALGYSAAGLVVEVGEEVTEVRVGDRVACAGTGYAAHAELLSVPKNLCARLPDEVDFESGAFATLGAIALQGVRLAEPTLGESVVVIGLGLIGQLAAQLLKANGCRVFGVDLDESKVELAKSLGADDGCASGVGLKEAVSKWSRGRGADAVVITAATSSDEPVGVAGEISRLRGRVVAVGLVGMKVPRQIYFQRELTLRVSMSYGPGRYDPEYEERGHDYPLPYVRWTEGRNLEAFLDLVAARSVRCAPLVTHRFPIEEGERAYRLISGETNLVVIATRHDSHAELARHALEQGKDVFVEKPLALDEEELDAVLEAAHASRGRLTVGFNRRFSPHAREAKEFFDDARSPLSILYRVNAGRVPRTHWTQDAREGGGRIRGEVCHFVDFMHFITGSRAVRVYAEPVTSEDHAAVDDDSIFVTLKFADGSNGTIAYLAEGDRSLAKERIEIFGAGRTFVIEDFRAAASYRDGRESRTRLRAQDKGQREEVRAVCAALRAGGRAPIPLDELAATTRAAFRILDSLRTGETVRVISDK
jgi:predicted dehydrogenase